MDLEYTKEEELFRDEVKDWINENLADSLKNKVLMHKRLTKEDYSFWHDKLKAKGWLC